MSGDLTDLPALPAGKEWRLRKDFRGWHLSAVAGYTRRDWHRLGRRVTRVYEVAYREIPMPYRPESVAPAILAAANAIAGAVTDRRLGTSLLPAMTQLRPISARVAVAVAEAAAAEGLADRPLTNPIQQVYEAMWQPVYPDVEVV